MTGDNVDAEEERRALRCSPPGVWPCTFRICHSALGYKPPRRRNRRMLPLLRGSTGRVIGSAVDFFLRREKDEGFFSRVSPDKAIDLADGALVAVQLLQRSGHRRYCDQEDQILLQVYQSSDMQPLV